MIKPPAGTDTVAPAVREREPQEVTSEKRAKNREKAVLMAAERRYRLFIHQEFDRSGLATSWRGRHGHDTHSGGDREDDCIQKRIFTIVRRSGRIQNHCPRTDVVSDCSTVPLENYHIMSTTAIAATTLDRLLAVLHFLCKKIV